MCVMSVSVCTSSVSGVCVYMVCVCVFVCVYSLETEPRTSHMLSIHSTTQLYPSLKTVQTSHPDDGGKTFVVELRHGDGECPLMGFVHQRQLGSSFRSHKHLTMSPTVWYHPALHGKGRNAIEMLF